MKKQIYQNIKQIFMTCFMCLIAFVFSFNSIYAEETGSITVDTPTEEMKVSLYRIGEFTDQGTFTLTKTYQSYAVSLDHSSSEKWQATANILANTFNEMESMRTKKEYLQVIKVLHSTIYLVAYI